MGSYTAYIIETFVTLAVVCGLAYAVLFGARRLGVGRPRGPIELVGQLPLDQRRSIYLVRVGAQVYVVAAGEGGFTKLGEVESASLPSEKTSHAFSTILSRALGGRGSSASRAKADDSGDGVPRDTETGSAGDASHVSEARDVRDERRRGEGDT